MDDLEVPIQAYIRVIGIPIDPTPPSSKPVNQPQTSIPTPSKVELTPYYESSDPLILTLIDQIRTSPDHSLKRRVCWIDVLGCVSRDYKQVFDDIAGKVYENLRLRKVFEGFYDGDRVINLGNNVERELKYYQRLFSIVGRGVGDFVCEFLGRQMEHDGSIDKGLLDKEKMGLLNYYLEKEVERVSGFGKVNGGIKGSFNG